MVFGRFFVLLSPPAQLVDPDKVVFPDHCKARPLNNPSLVDVTVPVLFALIPPVVPENGWL